MPKEFQYSRGQAHPLGATVSEDGVNFSLYSENATSVELLLFEQPGSKTPFQTIKLDPINNNTFNFWHVFVRSLKPGYAYAYRVDGPYDPQNGHRFNRNKVLSDPYAHEISKAVYDRAAACGKDDNVEQSLRCVVSDVKNFDWEDDQPLNRPMEETIIYEVHTGGFTKSMTAGVEHPGTFSGFKEKVPYLTELGITAVQIMPIFEFDDTYSLRYSAQPYPIVDFWGYDTIGFFSPHSHYCSDCYPGDRHTELKDLIKTLHKSGIEVILDVVFNHSGEGDHQGPTLSFRGLDNSNYYFLVPTNKEFYYDYSGCGNTIKCNHPVVQKFIIDCLEYWVKEFHVDGFRFDEASILSRGEDGAPLPNPPLIWQIELSETLANTKIIAEAWDAAGLFQVGRFPGYRSAELNGLYRDTIRRFVKGDSGIVKEVASRIAGSADVYEHMGRLPINSVNLVTTHDGFTMNDLVSYNEKHNDENGEDNHDGINENQSWNCGYEGPTSDTEVEKLRTKQIKNLIALLMLSKGVPLVLFGDEVRRTQFGNNNAYCQNNELGWMDWDNLKVHHDIYDFFKKMIGFRKSLASLNSHYFYSDQKNKRGLKQIDFHGTELYKPGWDDGSSQALAFTIAGSNEEPDLFVAANMSMNGLDFKLPPLEGRYWVKKINTAEAFPNDFTETGNGSIMENSINVMGHSIVVLISTQ